MSSTERFAHGEYDIELDVLLRAHLLRYDWNLQVVQHIAHGTVPSEAPTRHLTISSVESTYVHRPVVQTYRLDEAVVHYLSRESKQTNVGRKNGRIVLSVDYNRFNGTVKVLVYLTNIDDARVHTELLYVKSLVGVLPRKAVGSR